MEELHHIHKEVPFGYWVLWIEPAVRALKRKWRQRQEAAPTPSVRWQLLRWG